MFPYRHSSRSLKQHPEGIKTGDRGCQELDFLTTSLSEISVCCALFLPTACLVLSTNLPVLYYSSVCLLSPSVFFFFINFTWSHPHFPGQEHCCGSVYLQWSINRINFGMVMFLLQLLSSLLSTQLNNLRFIFSK